MTARVTGHFGEWIQGRLGPDGPIALVTVSCSSLWVEAERLGDGPLELRQTPEVLALDQARDLLDRVSGGGGVYRLTATTPPGGGAGASTAALVALARAAEGDPDRLVAACLAVEGASDPLMLPHPDGVLWASREGRILQAIPPLPRAEILGGFWGPSVATDPQDTAFADISDLVMRLQSPMSLAELAEVASISADRCRAWRGPEDDPTEALARDLNALGCLRAHTGSARGLIFAPGTIPAGVEEVLHRAGVTRLVRFTTGGKRGA